MIPARLPHRTERPELFKILGIAGAAAFAGAVIWSRLRSSPRNTPEMRRTGKEISSPLVGHEFNLLGHRFHILESARDTDDGSLRFDYSAPPGAHVSEHVHREQEERFEILSGMLGLRVGGRELLLGPGQSAVGPPMIPHEWWNSSDEEEVRFLVGIRPGLDAETILETVLGLIRDGKTIGPIPRNPLQLAVLAQEIGSWLVLSPAEKVLLVPVTALAFVGGLLGYSARYP